MRIDYPNLTQHQNDCLHLVRLTMEEVNAAYNRMRCPEVGDFNGMARLMYPAWMEKLDLITEDLNSYDWTLQQYKLKCAQFKNGWLKVMENVMKNVPRGTLQQS